MKDRSDRQNDASFRITRGNAGGRKAKKAKTHKRT